MDVDPLRQQLFGAQQEFEVLAKLGQGALSLPEHGVSGLVNQVAVVKFESIIEGMDEGQKASIDFQDVLRGLALIKGRLSDESKKTEAAGMKTLSSKKISVEEEMKIQEQREKIEGLSPDATLLGRIIQKRFSQELFDRSEITPQKIRNAAEHAKALHYSGILIMDEDQQALFENNIAALCASTKNKEVIRAGSEMVPLRFPPLRGVDGIKQALSDLIDLRVIDKEVFDIMEAIFSVKSGVGIDQSLISFIYECKAIQVAMSERGSGIPLDMQGILATKLGQIQSPAMMAMVNADLDVNNKAALFIQFMNYVREQVYPTNSQAPYLTFFSVIDQKAPEYVRQQNSLAKSESYLKSLDFFDATRTYFRLKSGYVRRFPGVANVWEKNSLIQDPKSPDIYHLNLEIVVPKISEKIASIEIDLEPFRENGNRTLQLAQKKALLMALRNRSALEKLLKMGKKPEGLEYLTERQLDKLYNLTLQVEMTIDANMIKLLRVLPRKMGQ